MAKISEMNSSFLGLSKILPWAAFLKRVLLANSNKLKVPYKYFFVVTKKCGSKCMYCKIWKEVPENELKLEDFRRMARNIGNALSWLNITGGEPTDRVDLVDIIRAFKEECPKILFVNFTTNGLQPERISAMANEIVSLGFGKVVINVSLDGPPEVNDKIRGVEGSFNNAIDTYLRLKKIKGLKTKLALTIYPQNTDLIEATYLAAKNFSASFRRSDLHLNIPHQSTHYYGNSQMKIDTFENSARLLNAIKEFRKRTSLTGFFSGTNFMEYLYQKKVPEYFAQKQTPLSCQALQSSIYVSEKGMVYPCTIWNKPLGNLADFNHNFHELSASAEYKNARQQIMQKNCPNCWTPCEAFTSILGSLPAALK